MSYLKPSGGSIDSYALPELAGRAAARRGLRRPAARRQAAWRYRRQCRTRSVGNCRQTQLPSTATA